MSKWYFENGSLSNYIVFEEEDEAVKLDMVAVGMSANNKIDGLVPFAFSQINSSRYVKFDITSRITLKQYLEKPLSRERLLNLLMSICGVIVGIKKYMINESSLMLCDDLIFVDVSDAKANFIINPELSEQNQVDYKSFFKNLFFVAQYESDNNFVSEIINMFNDNTAFSINKFYTKLKELKNSKPKAEINKQDLKYRADLIAKSVAAANSEPAMFQTQAPEKIVNNVSPKPQVETPEVSVSKTKKSSIIGKLFSGSKESAEPKKASKHKSKSANSLVGIAVPTGDENVVVIPASAEISTEQPQAEKKAEKFFDNEVYVDPSANRPPVVDDDSDSVTMLVEDYEDNSGLPKLQRAKTREMIALTKSPFIVGREKEFVDYCVSDNKSVGRSHACISQRNGLYYISDLNSRNHTYVNGVVLSTNQEVQLNNNDVIRLANEEFIFEI